MTKRIHPTKEKLIETMVALMENRALHEIQVDDVLRESNISKGSLYHHFENFEDLTEAALVTRFATSVDMSIDLVNSAVMTAKTPEEFVKQIVYITTVTQGPERRQFRLERARVIGLSVNSPKLLSSLALEQDRLNDAMADVVREGQERGWISKNFDARTVAVFIQSYTLGRVIDDVSSEDKRVDNDSWNDVVNAAAMALLAK